MKDTGRGTSLAWVSFACSLYSFLVVIIVGCFTLLGTYNVGLYYRLDSIVSGPVRGALLVGLLAAQVVCIVSVIAACACTRLRNFKHPLWKAGGIMFIATWFVVIAFILNGPWHAPPD